MTCCKLLTNFDHIMLQQVQLAISRIFLYWQLTKMKGIDCKLAYKGGYKHLLFEQTRQFLIDIQVSLWDRKTKYRLIYTYYQWFVLWEWISLSTNASKAKPEMQDAIRSLFRFQSKHKLRPIGYYISFGIVPCIHIHF